MGHHLYALVVRIVVLIIIGMVLHGDGVQEHRLIRGGLHALVLLDDLVCHGIIGNKAARPVVFPDLGHAMHILKADKIVKAKIGVSLVAAPVFCPEAVHGSGLIAPALEIIGHGKHGLGHMLLVGLAAAGQEGHRVAGQGFKFHITGAAAKAGAVGPAVGAGLLQCMQVLGDVRIKGDAVLFQLRDIPIGLVHHIDDGGVLHLLVLGRDGTVAGGIQRTGVELLALVHIVQQSIHCFLRVFLRLVDLQIGEVRHKAGDHAIVAVVTILHPCVRHNADGPGDDRL